MRRLLLAGALLMAAGPALAFCPSPNPNLLGPGHFVDNCPLPATGLNLAAPIGSPSFGSVLIQPTPNSLIHGLQVFQATSGSSATPYYANYIQVQPDAVDTGVNFRQAVGILDSYGYNVNGGTQSLAVLSFLSSATATGNTNRNYVAVNALAAARSGDTGTGGVSEANWKGAMFGIGAYGIACGTPVITGICPTGIPATNLLEITGGEVNVSGEVGSSMWYKGGWTIAALPTDKVQGTTWDCELCLSNQGGAVGWKDGILLGNMNGVHPLASGGTLLRSVSGSYTDGINLATDTISGKAWRSPGLTVSGLGVIVNTGIPTSCSGQATGTLWNNAGTVKVC